MIVMPLGHAVVAHELLVLPAEVPKLHLLVNWALKGRRLYGELCVSYVQLCGGSRLEVLLPDLLLLQVEELVYILV